MTRSGCRCLAAVVLVALMAAACGSSDGEGTGPEATASSTLPADTVGDGGPTTTGAGLGVFELVAAAGPDARAASEEVNAALDQLAADCADQDAAVEAIGRVTTAIDALRSAITPVIDQAGPDVASLWYDTIETGALLLDGCPGVDPVTVEPTDAGLRAAGALVAALDRLFAAFAPDRKPSVASRIWQSSDQLDQALWMRELVEAGEDLHTLIVGASTAKRSFDPTLMSAELDLIVGNAAIRSGSMETTSLWLDEIVPVVEPERVIIGISMFDLYARCRLAERAEPFANLQEKRRDALAPVLGPDVPLWAGQLGPVGEVTYDRSPLRSAVDFDFAEGTRGEAINEDVLVPERVEEFIGIYGELVSADEACFERFDLTAEVATKLLADGIEVIVVATPVLDDLAEFHPDGVDGWRSRLAEGVARLPDDVRFIDLADPLDRELFNDTWHVTTEGRRVLTEALIAAL